MQENFKGEKTVSRPQLKLDDGFYHEQEYFYRQFGFKAPSLSGRLF